MNGLLHTVPIAALSQSRTLFEHKELLTRIEAGAEISVAEPAGANGGKAPRASLGANGIAMFVLTPGKELEVVAAGDHTELHEGQELIGLRGCWSLPISRLVS